MQNWDCVLPGWNGAVVPEAIRSGFGVREKGREKGREKNSIRTPGTRKNTGKTPRFPFHFRAIACAKRPSGDSLADGCGITGKLPARTRGHPVADSAIGREEKFSRPCHHGPRAGVSFVALASRPEEPKLPEGTGRPDPQRAFWPLLAGFLRMARWPGDQGKRGATRSGSQVRRASDRCRLRMGCGSLGLSGQRGLCGEWPHPCLPVLREALRPTSEKHILSGRKVQDDLLQSPRSTALRRPLSIQTTFSPRRPKTNSGMARAPRKNENQSHSGREAQCRGEEAPGVLPQGFYRVSASVHFPQASQQK